MPRLDIAVIGSGPCALAFVSRLAAPPSAVDLSADFLFGFDSEIESLQTTIDRLNALKTSPTEKGHPLQGRVKVFEKSGAWMGKWDGLFEALGIQHLRSPHVAHPCPTHTNALLAHAEETKTVAGNKGEREAFADFKHLRYSGCHRAPSVPLFRSLCTHLRESLDLDSLLEQGAVLAIEPVYEDEKAGRAVSHFRLTLRRGDEAQGVIEVIEATSVVVATGSTSCPRLPEWWPSGPDTIDGPSDEHPPHALRHAWELPQDLCLSSPLPAPLRPHERVLVVGGGLTAVQLAVLAVDQGQAHATLASRRELVVKQFDFANAWVDRKRRPGLLRAFLKADNDTARLASIHAARGLSSIPPEALDMLHAREGGIDVRECSEVSSFPPPRWDAQTKRWRVVLECHKGTSAVMKGRVTTREEHFFDRIWCATGSDVRLEKHPLLGGLLAQRPIETCNGFPCLTPDLAWDEGCELYVLGAPAALRLGPDAFNLLGARTSAARVAHVLQERLKGADENEIKKNIQQAKQEVAALGFKYDRKREGVRSAGLARQVETGMGKEKKTRRGVCARKSKPRRGCC